MIPSGEISHQNRGAQLSPDKRRLLEQRLRRTSGLSHANRGGIAPRPPGARTLASPGQSRIWVLSEIDNNSPSHNVISSYELEGKVDCPALAFALNAVVARHEILRSAYRLEEGEIVQVVAPALALEVEQDRCSSTQEMLDHAQAFARIRFDLERGPLLRLGLFTSDAGRHVLVLAVHDIAFDKWSQRVFWREFSSCYRQAKSGTRADLPELPIQYSDFACWQRQFLKSGEQERQIAHWKRALQPPPAPLALPTDKPYPSNLGHEGSLLHSRIPESVTRDLRKLSAAQDASLFSTLLTGFAILLSRYAQTDDVLVASPVANRRKQETANLVGFFLNTLIIRHDFSDNPTCLEAIGRAKTAVMESLEHQDLPTDQIVEAVKPERVPGRHPLFQTMFVFLNEDERAVKPDLDGCSVTPIFVETKTAKFDLSLFVAESGEELEFLIEYRTDLFREETARRFLEHYATLMAQIAANPHLRISEIVFLTPREKQFCARNEQGPDLRIPNEITVLDLIRRHAGSSTTAVASSRHSISYEQLDRLSDNVASTLREHRAESNQPIAIGLERSPEAIIALLGILKAGAPYLAIDAGSPRERVQGLLADASVKHLITSRTTEDQFRFAEVDTLSIERAIDVSSRVQSTGPSGVSQDGNAYLIYTSGTSGQPKGVPVTHRNLLASTLSRIDYYATEPGSFLLLPSLSFDSSVAGLFWTLCTGGTLIVPSADEVRDPDAICALVAQHHVRVLLAVPSLYDQLLDWQPERLGSLKTAIVAGEACPARLFRKHLQTLPNCALYNEYGPTETTVWASVHRCDPHDDPPVPIGKPIPGCEIRILDARRRRAPVGFVGELCIGGLGLTQGYLNRPDLTASRFFTADDGTRLYATGDLARWLPEGNLEYHGRNDEQVKIRGYRIEVGEIESCLRDLPGVRDAAVLATSANSNSPPDLLSLETLLSILPEETVQSALTDLSVEDAGASGSAPAAFHRKVDQGDFEVSFTVKRPDFIAPPRKAQRDWLLGQAINEVADDLEHLDKIARAFVPGKDHKLQHDLVDLTDASLTDDQIMEDWQTPLMQAMAGYVSESSGDILEIGFGRGVSATFLQQGRPRSHTIIEMNRHTIERHFKPWHQAHPNADIRLRPGRWQDVLPDLGLFDAILFHTYPMNEEEFVKYILSSVTFAEHAFEAMASHLKSGGVFTYLTAEIDSLSRRHQRALLKHFSEISFKVVPVTVPTDTIDSWWANSMVTVKAVK